MATGRRAFQRNTPVETLSAIIRDDPEPVGSVNRQSPPPLRWIIERCLAKNSEERYVSTRDLARELASVWDHLSDTTLSGEFSAPVAPARSRRSLWLALDGRSIYVYRPAQSPARIYLLDSSNGRRSLWRELSPFDPAGLGVILNVAITPNGKSYAYDYGQVLSDLYLVEGLK